MRRFSVLFLCGAIANCGLLANSTADTPVEHYTFSVVQQWPHANTVFTQGLEFHHGRLYESGGQYGASSLSVRTIDSDQPLHRRTVADNYFAEGLTVFGDTLYLLTWKSGVVLRFDATTLEPKTPITINREAWGLTHNDHQLIMSDGSATLRFLDPSSLVITRELDVRRRGRPLRKLNELEWVDGMIYANVWTTNRVVIIDPNSGEVTGEIDFTGLLPTDLRQPQTDVLNGIAYDSGSKRLWVTGKYWPRLFEVTMTPAPP